MYDEKGNKFSTQGFVDIKSKPFCAFPTGYRRSHANLENAKREYLTIYFDCKGISTIETREMGHESLSA